MVDAIKQPSSRVGNKLVALRLNDPFHAVRIHLSHDSEAFFSCQLLLRLQLGCLQKLNNLRSYFVECAMGNVIYPDLCAENTGDIVSPIASVRQILPS